MKRYITVPILLILVLLGLAASLAAAPHYARIIVCTREASLSPRSVVEDDIVYASTDLLKLLGLDYVVGQHKVSVVKGITTVDLDLKDKEGTPMVRVDEAANLVNADYDYDGPASTVRLRAKLVGVEFKDSTLTAKFTLPVASPASRLWPDPWKIWLDVAGARVATSSKTFDGAGPDVSRIRVGQFADDTARIVVDLDHKVKYSVITSGMNREIKIAIGAAAAATAAAARPAAADPADAAPPVTPTPETEPAPPVTISAITPEPAGDSNIDVRITTSGQAKYKARILAGSLKVVIDVENATFSEPQADMPVGHPLLKAIRTGQQEGAARVVLDVTRYVSYKVEAQGNDLVVSLGLPTVSGGQLSDKTVVLDPGHGGRQPGAQAGGVKEKDITLLIAERVKTALEAAGVRVIMTREDDSELDLPSRPAVADANTADFFISVHCNALFPEARSGIETYYHSGHTSSRALAEAVHRRVIEMTGMKDRGARPDTVLFASGLAVLRNANVPAILIETGYIDCTSDRNKLCDDSYRSKLGDGIVQGLREYVEGN